ncbi:MAG TPA: hypothetical protein VEV13_02185, partial [Candidatus Limnocylindria bacterium]|nr:hypothetical protein [Candidatus Limnocylindria bacterium]
MSRVVLMGSGETAPTMVRVHRRVFADIGPGPAVLLDTPFGFQANADDLVEKTRTYFVESVGREVEVASWRRRDAPTVEQERALALLHSARWAFAGPGSPSYALRQWVGTPVPGALADVVGRGGTVCLGSAAAVLAGARAIPVYEIYKAGEDPHWLEGLDLLGSLAGLPAAVVPHYDNNEGGHYDTRYCYLGEERLTVLEAALPEATGILGVDEHTAVLLDLDAGTAEVVGSGGMTLRSGGVSQRFTAGTVLPLTEVATILRGENSSSRTATPASTGAPPPEGTVEPSTVASLRTVADDARSAFDAALDDRAVDGAVASVLDLEQSLQDWAADTQQGDDAYARRVLRAMVVHLGDVALVGARDPRDVVQPYVDLLL